MIRALTSASVIHRRALCPGSERLETGLPEDDSAQAREGTLLHEYDANPQLDRAVLRPNQRDLLATLSALDEFVFDRVKEQFTISDDELFDENREQELMALSDTEDATPGHCDRWRYYPNRKLLVIIDKKTGYKETTPAAANYQLRTYAIGGYAKWIAEHVVVAITQPRLPYEQRVTMAAYTIEDIQAAKFELMAIRKASRAPDAPLHASELACRYCKAKLICPAFQASITNGLAPALIEDGGTKERRLSELSQRITQCTDEQLSAVLVAIQFADFIKEQARSEARVRLMHGGMPGWKLGKESSMREIVDPARALRLLTLGAGLSNDDLLACAHIALGKVEEKLREKRGCTWQEAKDTINNVLTSVLEEKPKKQSVSRVGHKTIMERLCKEADAPRDG